jgi:geranylgeranyl transferase type-2 subunit beta
MNRYLQELTIRLAIGAAELPAPLRQRQIDFFSSCQSSDGGFAGREGPSDPYYTSFGLRALAILGELHGERAERAADFLRLKLQGQETWVDFFSLIYGASLLQISAGIDVFAGQGDWSSRIADFVESLRREDGGYAKSSEGAASSTYQSFLIAVALNLLEKPIPDPHRLQSFVLSQRGEDGGFREIRAAKRSGTNPTAAAQGTLRILCFQNDEVDDGVIDFIIDRQDSEGGLTANSRIPICDVLSTFTGIVTLLDLGALHELNLDAVSRFVNALAQPGGGYLAAAWDEKVDIEYSFYGLGCLSLLEYHKMHDDPGDGDDPGEMTPGESAES